MTALVAAVVAVGQRVEAIRQRNEAVALGLSNASQGLLDANEALSLALAAEATAVTPTPLREATSTLVDARLAFAAQRGQPIGEALTGHDGAVTSIAFSPHGTVVASG